MLNLAVLLLALDFYSLSLPIFFFWLSYMYFFSSIYFYFILFYFIFLLNLDYHVHKYLGDFNFYLNLIHSTGFLRDRLFGRRMSSWIQ